MKVSTRIREADLTLPLQTCGRRTNSTMRTHSLSRANKLMLSVLNEIIVSGGTTNVNKLYQ